MNVIFHFRKEYTKPTLELETTSGALLSDEDPLSLLFPLGAVQAEPVVGRIVKLSLPSLVDRYKDICSHSSIGKLILKLKPKIVRGKLPDSIVSCFDKQVFVIP